MKTKSTSLQGDSPANPIPQPGSEEAKQMTAISGQKCLEQLEKYDRVGLWGKTFADLLIGQTGWYSTRCNLTWKMKDTPFSRFFCQLAPSTPRTEGIESGSWLIKTPTKMDGDVSSGKANPVSGNSGTLAQEIMSGYTPTMQKLGLLPTPKATEIEEDYSEWKKRMVASGNPKNVGKTTTNLGTMARSGLLPTPTAMDSTGATANMKSTQVKDGSMHSVTLSRALGMGMLPTVATRDYKGARSTEALEAAGMNGNNSLPDTFAQTGKSSQLNPRFVLEMMGFPPNWTELPFLSGETNQ